MAGAAAATAAATAAVSATGSASAFRSAHPVLGDGPARRSAEATRIRSAAAREGLRDFIALQRTNGDEAFPDKRASFSKTLPHDENGEVDPAAYAALIAALSSGSNADFDAIPLDPTATRKLANPQGAYKFEMTGRDSHSTWMRPAPTFLGDETSAEMGEVYWKALCREVPFINFDTDPLIGAAVNDLNAFNAPVGPKQGNLITRSTVFRGETPGDLAGPYISQLLLQPIPWGPRTLDQRYMPSQQGVDFMTTKAEWLAVQRGSVPGSLVRVSPRYINDGRALGEYVHSDFSFQAYLNAALILLGINGSLDTANIYLTNSTQGGFVSLGGPDVLDLVSKAGNLALTGAWYQKWLVHRRARPEMYGGRLHHQLTGAADYNLPPEIGSSDALNRVFFNTGAYFLPMAFAEGSPTHPAYPAGHATIAGACCTVLKAFFNEDLPYPGPVQSSANGASLMPIGTALTLGGEINKLANNVALGRDWAGVHYRSDGVDGLLVGEQQAVTMLADYSRTYNEAFDGFTLTRFNGERIRISNGDVFPA